MTWAPIYYRSSCRNLQNFPIRVSLTSRLLHTIFDPRAPGDLPSPPALHKLETSADSDQARAWLKDFKSSVITRGLVDCTFARSSGPGGQNVNKVNTKAVVRCPLDSKWIPFWAKPALKASPYYVASSRSILITSTVFRSQAQNVNDCLSKLHALIHDSSAASIKNDPTEEQRKRVLALERADKVKNRKEKEHRAEVKKARSSKTRHSDVD